VNGTTSTDHIERVQRALDYIDDHLCDELTIETLAGTAAFSTWHFQRVFSAMVGEPVMSYVRRRRLASAMIELATTRRRIIEIAWDHCFESQESFTRAFKSTFGITPGHCRRHGVDSLLCAARPKITREYLNGKYGGWNMQPVIRTLTEKKVVGMGAPFISILSPDRNNHIVIPRLWDRFIGRIGEIAGRIGHETLGLCGELPAGIERSRDDEFYYIACAEVESLEDLPDGMIGRVVPAATFAVFTHVGSLDRLGRTMDYIYGSWLPGSGHERPADVPDLELYDERFDPASERSEIDIYIPIG
jgi:AraC family transcriptional regulator